MESRFHQMTDRNEETSTTLIWVVGMLEKITPQESTNNVVGKARSCKLLVSLEMKIGVKV